ncbi:MAG: hypothetical protein NTW59_03140 [Candidatus Diapherotrites archaeon]|nr:hypothetical protein [Candidatus Diapherotrites archaeon]
MNSKAQVSIEFIIIIVIALIYINTITNPLLIQTSTASAEDVQHVGDARIAAQKLANAINEAAASPGESRKTVQLYLPANSGISCDRTNKEIDYSARVSNLYCRQPAVTCSYSESEACAAGVGTFNCSSSVPLLAAAELHDPLCPSMEGPLYRNFVVAKDAFGVIDVQ